MEKGNLGIMADYEDPDLTSRRHKIIVTFMQLTLKTTQILAGQMFHNNCREEATGKRVGGMEAELRIKSLAGLTTKGRDAISTEKQEDQIPHQEPLALGTCTGKMNPHNIWL